MKPIFQQGEYVLLMDITYTYVEFREYNAECGVKNSPLHSMVIEYIRRYKPRNATLTKENDYFKGEFWKAKFRNGYKTPTDLAKRTDLTWKVKSVIQLSQEFSYVYILSSNKNHMIVCGASSIAKMD